MRNIFSEHGQLILVALLLSLIIFVAIDFTTGDNKIAVGRVVDKHYREARTYVTIQTGSDSKGHSYSRPVVHHDPPEWTIVIRTASGDVFQIDCRPDIYYSNNAGDSLEFVTRSGGMSHIPYLRRAIKTKEGY